MSLHRLKNLISSQSAVGFFPFSFKGRPPAGKSLIGLFRKATCWKVTINREQCCGTFFVLCDWICSHPLAQRKPPLTIEAFVTFQMFVPKRCISIQARGAWGLNRGRQGEEGSAGSQTPLQTPWAAVTFDTPLLLFSKIRAHRPRSSVKADFFCYRLCLIV